MFQKIKLLIQGKLPDYNEYLQVASELQLARQKIFDLEMEKLHREKSKRGDKIQVAGFDNMDLEPTDEKERVSYAAQVDEFYQNILRDKIYTSIGDIRQLLSLASASPGFERVPRAQYDFFLRGMEAGLWKIVDWVEGLQAELASKK